MNYLEPITSVDAVPDDEVCEIVREHRERLRAWDREHANSINANKEHAVSSQSTSTQQSVGNVRHAFDLLVCAAMQRNGGNRQRAIRTVARREPGLYAEYLKTLPTAQAQLPRKQARHG